MMITVIDSYLKLGVRCEPDGGHPYAHPMAKNDGGRKGLNIGLCFCLWLSCFGSTFITFQLAREFLIHRADISTLSIIAERSYT